MGGATSTGPNPVCTTEFGCGGVFRLELSSSTLLDLCNFGDIIGVVPPAVPTCSSAVMPQPASLSDPPKSSEKLSPQLIITQSGSRFPTGGSPWGFTPVPIALAMDSSATSTEQLPGCVDSSYSTPYQPDPNCVADHPNSSPSAVSVQSTIFEMTPPSETSNSAGRRPSFIPLAGTVPWQQGHQPTAEVRSQGSRSPPMATSMDSAATERHLFTASAAPPICPARCSNYQCKAAASRTT